MHVLIHVQGHLDHSWQEWLDGLAITHEIDGTSRLSGRLKDQPALYGVLGKLNRLNLPLLALTCSKTNENTTDLYQWTTKGKSTDMHER